MREIAIRDSNLEDRIDEKRRREVFVETDNGKRRLLQLMLEIFEYLRLSGYKIPEDSPERMAEIWAEQLQDYVVTYGTDVVKDAVKRFVINDNREYRQYPNAARIIQEVKRLGHDPDVEAARKKYEDIITKMEMEQTERARRELTPEIRAKWEKQIMKSKV